MNFNLVSKFLLFFFLSTTCLGQKSFELINKVYDPFIKTVQLYPVGTESNSQLASASIPLLGSQKLILEFDELFNDASTYQVQYIRCDANWQKSTLSDLEFLTTYNEFTINEYEYSFNTKTPYVHYKIILPKPKLSGNYVLIVYTDGDKDDIILTHRFMVFENKVQFTSLHGFTGFSNASRFNQELEFVLDYRGFPIQRPQNQISVSILQNQSWSTLHQNIKPTFTKEDEYTLDFKYFTKETLFLGGNEFRFFDIRSLKYPGENIKAVYPEKNNVFTLIKDDRSRNGLAYSTNLRDLNGNFIIDNVEGKNPAIENDYTKVEFTLISPKLNAAIYISGGLTNWNISKDNLLFYDTISAAYKGALILKQGWYNYHYIVEDKTLSRSHFEGNWSATVNEYQLVVYYRPYNLASDLIIGYLHINKN